MYRILAADIGATNSRFALFCASDSGPLLRLERERWLKGADYPTFDDALCELRQPQSGEAPFFDPAQAMPDIAIIAPAGPILGAPGRQRCRTSNLAWDIDAQKTAQLLEIAYVELINDFAAQAQAVLLPEAIDAACILTGRAVAKAPRAVVGAGTGFGKALVLCSQAPVNETRAAMLVRLAGAVILPSEGGHAEFPFVGKEEMDFAAFVARREATPRLIFDSIVSGKGLAHIHAWVSGKSVHPHEATAQAVENEDVMALYARFYGRACKAFVLETLALGGCYVAGGMALRVPVLRHPAFAEEFFASTVQEDLLRNIPVWQVKNPQAGLWGAALYGLLRLVKEKKK